MKVLPVLKLQLRRRGIIRRARQFRGFTMVELATVVIIIGILAATALSNFIKAQAKAKVAAVVDNMHTIQVAAEAYATDTGGVYPANPSSFAPYLPGGGNTQGGASGTWPNNPVTEVAAELPFAETVSDSAGVQTLRNSPPGASPGTPGQVGYAQCDAPESTSYAVTGTNDAGKRIGSVNTTTVLSNH